MASDAENCVYLDYNATTPIHPDVVAEISKQMTSFGNPSSAHRYGQRAKQALEGFREMTSKAFKVDPSQVVYMSGGTEVNHAVINAAVESYRNKFSEQSVVITSKTEHPSILHYLERLAENGKIRIVYLPIDSSTGFLDCTSVTDEELQQCSLITLMYANNETGVIQPLDTIFSHFMERCSAFKASALSRPVLHSDASQAVGRVPLALSYIDVITVTGHKIGGPCIAALVAPNPAFVDVLKRYPLFFGGGQESSARSGTENLPMIAGLSRAVAIAVDSVNEYSKVEALRDYFEEQLVARVQAKSLFRSCPRLPNTASIVFPWLSSTASELLTQCQQSFAASTGAACHANAITISPCLLAFGLSAEDSMRTVRFSLGKETTRAEIDSVIGVLREALLLEQPPQP